MDTETTGVQQSTEGTQEQVSTTELASTEGEAQTQAPLTAEAIQKMIDDAVTKTKEEAKEEGRRELQRQQDRNRAALEREGRKTKAAGDTLESLQARLQELDPDVAKEMELEMLRAREKGRVSSEQEEAIRQQQETFARTLQESLVNHLKALGIDPEDKRVDWAPDTNNYVDGRNRFDASVAKIIEGDKQTMQKGFEQRLKDLEGKVAQVSTEANSVETTTSPGVVAGSDAEFVKKFASGEILMTQENVDRYSKIVESY